MVARVLPHPQLPEALEAEALVPEPRRLLVAVLSPPQEGQREAARALLFCRPRSDAAALAALTLLAALVTMAVVVADRQTEQRSQAALVASRAAAAQHQGPLQLQAALVACLLAAAAHRQLGPWPQRVALVDRAAVAAVVLLCGLTARQQPPARALQAAGASSST